MHNNMIILREHYDAVDQPAFDVAIRWGRARYRKKLTPSSVHTLRELLIKAPVVMEEEPVVPQLSPLDYPPLPQPAGPPLEPAVPPPPSPPSFPPPPTNPLIQQQPEPAMDPCASADRGGGPAAGTQPEIQHQTSRITHEVRVEIHPSLKEY